MTGKHSTYRIALDVGGLRKHKKERSMEDACEAARDYWAAVEAGRWESVAAIADETVAWLRAEADEEERQGKTLVAAALRVEARGVERGVLADDMARMYWAAVAVWDWETVNAMADEAVARLRADEEERQGRMHDAMALRVEAREIEQGILPPYADLAGPSS